MTVTPAHRRCIVAVLRCIAGALCPVMRTFNLLDRKSGCPDFSATMRRRAMMPRFHVKHLALPSLKQNLYGLPEKIVLLLKKSINTRTLSHAIR
ncbi:MAG: hypothetical protein HQ592_16525 [Planctomycetes bacterium]|nr:hypothetical protein [Planctomycetota bacterium]